MFVPFEEASQKASKSAVNIGRVMGIGLLIILACIILAFPKPKHKNLLGEPEVETPEVLRGEGEVAAPPAGDEAPAP